MKWSKNSKRSLYLVTLLFRYIILSSHTLTVISTRRLSYTQTHTSPFLSFSRGLLTYMLLQSILQITMETVRLTAVFFVRAVRTIRVGVAAMNKVNAGLVTLKFIRQATWRERINVSDYFSLHQILSVSLFLFACDRVLVCVRVLVVCVFGFRKSTSKLLD